MDFNRTPKQMVEDMKVVCKEYENMLPPLIAIGLSYRMYQQLRDSCIRSETMNAMGVRLVCLTHFYAFGTKGMTLEIRSYGMLHAVQKVDENFIQLGIKNPEMLQGWLDIYEKEYNTRTGVIHESH